MKGPKELKRYVAKRRSYLKVIGWDSLLIFKLERCRKWRGRHRLPRDGYGRSAQDQQRDSGP